MQILRRSNFVFHLVLAGMLGGAAAVVGAKATPVGAWLGLVPPLVVAWATLRRPLRRWRVARQPLPAAWRAWLEAHVPLYAGLPPEGRARFERDVRFILDEWTFEPVGVEVDDGHRLGVAAGAALLLHGRPDWELPARHTVLFYPSTFDEDYLGSDRAAFDGMAHEQGPVIVAAQAVEDGWANPFDGSNVVLHELAHLLDYLNASADGIPALVDPGSVDAWRRLVRREMQAARLGKSLLRSYAATNPAEFFAVAVENFFERPALLRRRHPELFDALVAFFALDPTPPGEEDAKSEPAPAPEETRDDAGGP